MVSDVLVIGSGISGLSAAIFNAMNGKTVTIVSPHGSDRSQSIMAAGGINAALSPDDSCELHAKETIDGGVNLENYADVLAFCKSAPSIIEFLEKCGVVLTRKPDGSVDLRSFGGQSKKRTAYAGTATGKIIVTCLVQKAREYECSGLIKRRHGLNFYQALIKNNVCYGAAFYNEELNCIEHIYAKHTVVATGGMNQLFGKTTGSTLCDGYVVGKLFEQGVKLRNLEFIQYHPTTIETHYKRMLISEAARGEGGRLFYFDGNDKRYFMEEKYGPNGNLMCRDIVSKCIFDTKKQCYLDITFIDKNIINSKLSEIKTLCETYINLDVTKEYIPVYPSVHFFMGGIAVNSDHKTNIDNLFAVGECASKYHGANRLGGNSLLAAIYSGKKAADAIKLNNKNVDIPDFASLLESDNALMADKRETRSKYPDVFIRRELASVMNASLGIIRTENSLKSGLESIDFYLDVVSKLSFDPDVSLYNAYSLRNKLILCKAILLSALNRKESRGAHLRDDYPDKKEEYRASSYIEYNNGDIKVSLIKDYEDENNN